MNKAQKRRLRAEQFAREMEIHPKDCVLEDSSFGTTIIQRYSFGDREVLIEDDEMHSAIVEWLRGNGAEIRKL
jgi:hypothetical protein